MESSLGLKSGGFGRHHFVLEDWDPNISSPKKNYNFKFKRTDKLMEIKKHLQ